MAKKTKAAKDAAETVLKKAQKKADELVAAAQDAADAARKSAKKAKKSAKAAGKSSKTAEKSSKRVETVGLSAPEAESTPVVEPSTEDAPAAESLPLPTADDPDVPSEAWTVAKLRATAKERGVIGIGTMRKGQLIAALTDAG